MFNLVSLLVAAALVSLQCGFEANALLDNKHLDNDIRVNMIPSGKRHAQNFISIQQAPPESTRLDGAPVPLRCETFGSPTPTVRWLKNGEPISDHLDESNEITPVYPASMAWLLSTLVVTNAASGDEFTCVASNGITSETATTTVYTEPGEDPELLGLSLFTAPIITLYYEQLFQEISTNVILPCRVSSVSQPQVYWKDTNNKMVYGNSRMRVLPSGDLFIAGIRWTDMGDYTCTVKNLYGTASAVTFLYPAKPGHVRQKIQ